MKQYIIIKHAFDALRSHPSLGPKVTGRWITNGRLYELVKPHLANTYLKDLNQQQFTRGLCKHPAFDGVITRQQENDVGLYRLDVNKEFFYWIGDKPNFPRRSTPEWKQQVLEAEERVFSTRQEASAAESNTARAPEIGEDEMQANRPGHDDTSASQSNSVRAAEMDDDQLPANRPGHDDAAASQSNTARAAEMDEDELPANHDDTSASQSNTFRAAYRDEDYPYLELQAQLPPTKLQYDYVKAAFDEVRYHPSLGPKVTGRWVTDGCLHELVKLQLVDSHLKDLKKKHFNRGLIRHPAFKNVITQKENDVGFYRIDVDSEWFYWIGDNPKFPRLFTPGWKEQVLEVEERVMSNEYDASAAESNSARAAELDEDQPPAKRPRHEPSDIQQQTYWDSPEALKMFLPKEGDASVLACIERRIQLFSAVVDTLEGWRLVIDGGDPDNLCSSQYVFELRKRCQLLCQALIFAKTHMSTIPCPGRRRWNWSECCDTACKHLNPSGNRYTRSGQSLRRHHAVFIQKDMFPHPNPDVIAS
jgi:hypothetical protein